eukprot:1783755-Rhodomonas_salina.2
MSVGSGLAGIDRERCLPDHRLQPVPTATGPSQVCFPDSIAMTYHRATVFAGREVYDRRAQTDLGASWSATS